MILDEILYNLKNEKKACYAINNETYTYTQMYQYVCNIYKYLCINNEEKRPVIVYGDKQVYMKACFLACSFAGITYVSVDESMPKDRVIAIINQINPFVVVGNFECEFVKNISVEEIYSIMNRDDYENIDKVYMKQDDIYYIIFTSGSTGIPKGVKVTYGNVSSCINWLRKELKTKNETILNQASFSFDLSVADLYLSLLDGSSQFVLEKEVKNNFVKLFEQIKKSNCTLAVITPLFADYLLIDKSFNEDNLPNLRKIIFCGEKLLKTTIEKLFIRFSNINIINSYGPTECTFAVTSINITKEMLENDNIPIGKPKDDVTIYIIEDEQNVLKENEIGEILISGKSVAKGYVHDIDKKAFINFKDEKAYLTGDLGYYKNGLLYFVSRKDKQIKYKGYRIESADIEENLYKLGYVEKAVVVPKTNEKNIVTKIYAFIKVNNNEKKEDIIKKDLLQYLPEYMCPIIKVVQEFPMNSNEKCDERKLLEDYKNGR